MCEAADGLKLACLLTTICCMVVLSENHQYESNHVSYSKRSLNQYSQYSVFVEINPLVKSGITDSVNNFELYPRSNVIIQSSDDLPCSFVLLKVSTAGNVRTVVGFSRLSKVLQKPNSALVESGKFGHNY